MLEQLTVALVNDALRTVPEGQDDLGRDLGRDHGRDRKRRRLAPLRRRRAAALTPAAIAR